MGQCGHNLGSKFAPFLAILALILDIRTGSATHYRATQHGVEQRREENLGEKFHLLFPSILRLKTTDPVGHLAGGVAKNEGSTDTIVSSLDFIVERGEYDDAERLQSLGFIGEENNDQRLRRGLAKRSTTEDKINDENIPLSSILFLTLQYGISVSNLQLNRLLQQVADILDLPRENVLVNNKWTSSNVLGLYVLKRGAHPETAVTEDLMTADQVQQQLVAKELNASLPDLYIQDVFVKDDLALSADDGSHNGHFWTQPYFPFVAACAGVILITLVISLSWYCAFRGRSKTSDYSVNGASSQPSHIPQQICSLYPTAKPDVHNTTAIQPSLSLLGSSKSALGSYGSPQHTGSISPLTGSVSPRSLMSGTPSSSPTCGTPITGSSTPIHTPPMRIRAKLGLLERRGSNASLTLDLAPSTQSSQDNSSWGSPPRESCAEEFLLSAGNRLSRKQLRSCLKNVRALHEEFWEIPMNHPDRIEVAGSGMKNRYRTIIPNEHSRVRLSETDDDPIASYINANYIRGYAAEARAYIATQGPMSNTVTDFWRMIWQEKAPLIVMITKLREKNRTKCESYLPEHTTRYGNIEVTTTSISERTGHILRMLTLKCGDEEHTVSHYWYTAWPDHKAPNTARTLLDLVKLVDQQRYDPVTGKVPGPVVVHCSAGIGRTGCFIAASIGIQQLREEHMVNVLAILCAMRTDRGGMIQTNEQYEFVYQTLCLFERELPDNPRSGGD